MSLLELPSNRAEEWRWSDLSALPAYAEAAPTGDVPADLPWIDCEISGPRLLFVDGEFDAAGSDPREVKVSPVRDRPGTQPLADLAAAEARAGYVIELGANGAASGLVQIIHVSTGGAAHLSNRIVLADDAQASVVETHVGSGWSNVTTVLELGNAARLMRVIRVLKGGGAHTDFGSLTLVYGHPSANGLQVWNGSEWEDVPVAPDTFVVNLGDLMAQWTNDLWVSTLHRVVNPPPERRGFSRYSMPFFLHPNPEFLIETLPGCISADNPNRYPTPITAHDYLHERLVEIGLVKA